VRERQYFGDVEGLTGVVVVGIEDPVDAVAGVADGEVVELDFELLPQPVTATIAATAAMVNSARFISGAPP
jgi:hypothetical protein